MSDLIFVGLTLAFFALTAWLVGFSDRIMPAPVQREGSEESHRKETP